MKSSSSYSSTFFGASTFSIGLFLSSSSTCFEFTKTAPPKISSSTFVSSYLGVSPFSYAPCFSLIFSFLTRFLAWSYYYFFYFLTIFSLSWTPAICFQGNWLYISKRFSSKKVRILSSSRLSRSSYSHRSVNTFATFLAKRAKSLSFLRTWVLAFISWLLLANLAPS